MTGLMSPPMAAGDALVHLGNSFKIRHRHRGSTPRDRAFLAGLPARGRVWAKVRPGRRAFSRRIWPKAPSSLSERGDGRSLHAEFQVHVRASRDPEEPAARVDSAAR